MNENPNNNQVDSRYQTEGYITSIGEIPQGYVYSEHYIYVSGKKYSLKNWINPYQGYVDAYMDCLNAFKKNIDEGHCDAVFNLRSSIHNVEGNYEVVLTGDAAKLL